MKTIEFCYWLQGYFELRDNGSALTHKQLECIAKHIKLVQEVEGKLAGSIVHWISGLIDGINTSESLPEELQSEILANTTELIRARLHEVFQHDIDNTYGDKAILDKLNKIHKPDIKPTVIEPIHNPNILIRC